MHKTPFTKMNGAGNDFVLLDNRAGQISGLSAAAIARLCDRHRGVGADGVLVVEAARSADTDFRMRYYNSDGGEAEMCGNGARCFARFAGRLLGNPAERISFETPAGPIRAGFEGERVRLQMSDPRDVRFGLGLEDGGERWTAHFLDTGVPHAVIFVDDVEAVDVALVGRVVRYHPEFAPRGTNVNFVQMLALGRLLVRTYERGVEAETLACGTGAVASALVHAALHGAGSPVAVRVRGGDDLFVGFERPEGQLEAFVNVTLTGPADFAFSGEIEI